MVPTLIHAIFNLLSPVLKSNAGDKKLKMRFSHLDGLKMT